MVVHILSFRVLPWIPWPFISCFHLFFRVFPCASVARRFLDLIFPCSSVDSVAIHILFSSFLLCISVCFRGKKIFRSYLSVFFRGFRGHSYLVFIFSSVYFRVLPWQKDFRSWFFIAGIKAHPNESGSRPKCRVVWVVVSAAAQIHVR